MLIAERNIHLDESSLVSPEPAYNLLVIFLSLLSFFVVVIEQISPVLIGPGSFVYILKQPTYAPKHCICIK